MGYFFNIVADALRNYRIDSNQASFANAEKLMPEKNMLNGVHGEERTTISPDVTSSFFQQQGFPSPEEYSGELQKSESLNQGDSTSWIGVENTEVDTDIHRNEPISYSGKFTNQLSDNLEQMEGNAEEKQNSMHRLNGSLLGITTNIPADIDTQAQPYFMTEFNITKGEVVDLNNKSEPNDEDGALFTTSTENEQTIKSSQLKEVQSAAELHSAHHIPKEEVDFHDNMVGESKLPRKFNWLEDTRIEKDTPRILSVNSESVNITELTTNLNNEAGNVVTKVESGLSLAPGQPNKDAKRGFTPNAEDNGNLYIPLSQEEALKSDSLSEVEHNSTLSIHRPVVTSPQVVIGSIEVIVEATPAQTTQPASGFSRDLSRYYLRRL
jgi:hypothetical protein